MRGRRLFRHLMLLALGACFAAPPPAYATADPAVLRLPEAFVPDNVTEHAVYCSITLGYPNNIYAIKGVFSNGDLPYYGLTYNPLSMLWVPQIGAWSTSQPKVQTDAEGNWRGYVWMRLETTAPRKDLQFRISVIPLSPVSNPGPTVGDWMPVRALDTSLSGNGGWLRGHVYQDEACTIPAEGVVVCLWDGAKGTGRLLGAYLSQNSCVMDDEDATDAGAFRVSARAGTVASLTARHRVTGATVPVFTRVPSPWIVRAGRETSVDASIWGDLDGDGALTLADVVQASRMAAGLSLCSEADRRTADVWPGTDEQRITLFDAATLLKKALQSGG